MTIHPESAVPLVPFLLLAALLPALAWAGFPPRGEDSAGAAPDSVTAPQLLDFAMAGWRSDPAVRVEDAYKWLYQAALGGEHAIAEETGPRRWLDEEWAGLGEPREGEPLAQALRPDGSVLRINLRPFKAAGGQRERLLRAFVESARAFRGDRALFLAAWSELGRRLRAGGEAQPAGLRFADWQALDEAARAEGYPAVHHSPSYEQAHAPAYRVVLARVWLPRDP